MKGIGAGQSRVRKVKVRVAKGQGDKCRGAESWGGKRARGQRPGGLVLRTYIVGWMG